ncbi:MAG: phosphomannomutase [Candidatus Scalindua sp. AMX11]|nr:MAG: phosphomannomutase [Candidatus Scalindua sp.]NOG83041.1 phosphomannomutase [Planctomycetota bacterium]RZV79559.1 MAG: phosphomannomutase [Candidatus Scalindua sp. SCAELEC01]TDE65198.1 MAG: phosphomannomutase [Candidatus Scalindua sp. AMX11]GJQ58565.1 MAG: phosphomannomutase [Candidatus Scalindua sp.]
MKTESFHNADECWEIIRSDIKKNAPLLKEIKKFALESKTPTTVVFGTSGWRGEIGTDFTFNNVRITTTAIIEMFKEEDPKLMMALGVKNFDEIKERGVIVGHDNRFLGPEFASTVMGLLTNVGIKVYYAGESITPELSASIEMLQAACSINLTPSHNPSNYAGFKFNPSDGGPADKEITTIIERNANRLMAENRIIEEKKPEGVKTINSIVLYEGFIKKRGIVDLERIRCFIKEKDCFICIDHIHGATRKRPNILLGENSKIEYLRTNDDYLFGGVPPEPSEKNMKIVMETLRKKNSRLKLGVIMDPDGDRIRFTDGEVDISMNHFGAMALHFLYTYKKISGVLVKSVATSNFGNAIAGRLGIPIRETAVGFKNFRPYLLQDAKERAIVAYEESDGISGYNNTLEKDAMFGLFLAIEMMMVTGKNLGEYLRELEEEFGVFFPERAAVEVDRSLAGSLLSQKLSVLKETLSVGNKISTGNVIKDLITVDGIKVVLDDDSWFLIRPSGTEPKVRFYVETRSPENLDNMITLADTLTKKALDK